MGGVNIAGVDGSDLSNTNVNTGESMTKGGKGPDLDIKATGKSTVRGVDVGSGQASIEAGGGSLVEEVQAGRHPPEPRKRWLVIWLLPILLVIIAGLFGLLETEPGQRVLGCGGHQGDGRPGE